MTQYIDVSQFIEMQQELMKQIEPIFNMLGLKLYAAKIVLKPKDCETELGNKCIDYVWRVECESEATCEELRKRIKEQMEQEG